MIYFDNRQHSVNRRLPILSILALFLLSEFALSQDVNDEALLVPPENWYQVEVILFTQAASTSGELPPVDYQLNFPDSLLQLVDTEAVAEQKAKAIEGALLPDPDHLPVEDPFPFASVIPTIEMEDPATDPIISDSYMGSIIDSVSDALDVIIPTLEPFLPEYEQPFELLPFSARDLNDSARVLDRRKYNVIFHEAWRFVADENGRDPWVMISSGKKIDDRAEVEGGLRFYRARFLHFETNLWRLNFADQASADRGDLIELPDTPTMGSTSEPVQSWRIVLKQETSEPPASTDNTVSLEANLRTDENATADLNIADIPDIQANAAEDYEKDLIATIQVVSSDALDAGMTVLTAGATDVTNVLAIEGDSYVLEQFDPKLESLDEEPAEDKTYAISSVWPITQSKRIEEEKVYYLDHPELGIMLTIKSYEPQPINLEPTVILDPSLVVE
ncbi:peptidoglycan binding protein CsiV [Gammaproteobacteria bacterium]|nr:peptidoglycan binding protein CsiV [Gammaproteobacteria bacterium]